MSEKNIYLVGLRGSGKSTVGKLLARKLRWEFADQDSLIEKRAGKTIAEIFASGGEPEFRKIESEVLHQLAKRTETVVAAGGGAVLSEENCKLMRETGVVVHLDGPAELFCERITKDSKSRLTRPALTKAQSSLEEMRELAAVRAPLYEKARHYCVSAADSPKQVAGMILNLLAERGIKAK
jgi:shikimate kinase